jgi:hypothetical protein
MESDRAKQQREAAEKAYDDAEAARLAREAEAGTAYAEQTSEFRERLRQDSGIRQQEKPAPAKRAWWAFWRK